MSWPADGQPRYVVKTGEGYTLVTDRACCHRTVAEYVALGASGLTGVVIAKRPKQAAAEHAARLNAA